MDTSLTSYDADCPPQKKTRFDSKVGSGGHKQYFGRKRRKSKASKSNVTPSMFNVGDSVLFKLQGEIYVGTVLSQVNPNQYTIQDVTGSIHAVVIDDLYEGLQVSSNDRLPTVGEVVFVRYSDKTGVVRLGKTICIRNDSLWITFDNSGLEFNVPFNEAFILNEQSKQLGVGNVGLGEMGVNENGGTREAIHLFTCMLNRLTEETIHTHSDYRDRASQIRELYVQDIRSRDSAILELKQQHLVDTVTINQLGCEWFNRWSALSQSTKSLQEKLGSTIKESEGYCAEIQRLQCRLFLQESVFSKTVLRLEGEISELKDNVVRLETESMLNSMVSDSRVHEAEVEAARLESDLFEKDREIRDLKCKLGKLTGKDMLERVGREGCGFKCR
ncbi:uncharacterized protein LOC135499156 [Lineus longissimus]|uniref:uncharacterized protein LOC135499156 n=1 Tax=Lineus longissimus TaxID=88925 RepID=UPI00315D3733